MFLYAVPPVFVHDVVPKYPALQQRIQTPNYFSRSNPFSPQINLDRLDVPDAELLTEIANRLLAIFEVAYGAKLDAAIQAQNIATLSQAARESYLAISHRRLFIKALVTEWYRQKEEGEHALSPDYAAAAIRGQSEALGALADSMQSPY
jgi:bacteriophage exclusion system BrxC/D-like protein